MKLKVHLAKKMQKFKTGGSVDKKLSYEEFVKRKNVSGTAFYITTESVKRSGRDFNTLANTMFASEDEFNRTKGIIQYTFFINVENQYNIVPAIYKQMEQDGIIYSDGIIQIIGFEVDNYTKQTNSSPAPHNFKSELPYPKSDYEDEDGEYKDGGGITDALELLKNKIRSISKKMEIYGESGYGGYVVYLDKDKIEISTYTNLSPYSAQASDEVSVSFNAPNTTMIIFSTNVSERFEDNNSFEKYGGIKYIYEPLTNKIASEILEKIKL